MTKQILKIALKGILAGIAISIGGFLFIKTNSLYGFGLQNLHIIFLLF